jgi:aryl-alcohol dehydrogenase-like predicted oxidoreductase
MLTRVLGRSGFQVSAMGLGCWAIGGPLRSADSAYPGHLSWGSVDDSESIRAIHKALGLGINFFDTADAYGAGHSERILGKAVAGRRDQVIIATKFGDIFEEESRTWLGHSHPDGIVTGKYVRAACEASLRRLNTNYLDLYQFHWSDYSPDLAVDLLPILEALVSEGKIRWYGWSTGDPKRARIFAEGAHCTAIQYNYNVLERNSPMQANCEELNLASIARGPLGMGLLTGKFHHDSEIPKEDVRSLFWDLQHGQEKDDLDMLEAIRSIMMRDGRTLAQAALGWLWARGPQIIPIPGFRNQKQVEENARSSQFGPLSDEQMREIDAILGE